MRKIIVTTNITLDGVMQAPMGSDEDTSGAFRYGGWTAPNADAISGKAVQKEANQTADYLLGRKTFEIFASFWPNNASMWPGINDRTKYVLSKTIKNSDWKNTVFLESLEDIKKLRIQRVLIYRFGVAASLFTFFLKMVWWMNFISEFFPLYLAREKSYFIMMR